MDTMYNADINSTNTKLTVSINSTATSITVDDSSVLPPAPNIAVIGFTTPDPETILYTSKDDGTDTISGVTRGFQGTAQSWASGIRTARTFTAYDHNSFKNNIEELNSNKVNNTGDAIDGNLTISGDLTVNGSTVKVDSELTASDNLIMLNEGEAGDGVTAGTAGIEVDRGTLTNYKFLFDEGSDVFEVGESGALQPVATRESSPVSTGIPFWDSSTYKFTTQTDITKSNMVFTDSRNSMINNFDMGNNAIINVGNVDGVDISSLNTTVGNHTSNTTNPHTVTKSQVGLGNVENKALSTITWSDLGVSKYTDSEAVSAVSSVDNYVKNTGDVIDGDLKISANGANLVVQSDNGNSSDDYPATLYLKEDGSYDHGFKLEYFGVSNYASISTVVNGTKTEHMKLDRATGDVHLPNGNLTLTGTVDGVDIAGLNTTVSNHKSNTSDPHSVTKTQVGLGNLTNDQQVPKAGGNFTGGVDIGNPSADRIQLSRSNLRMSVFDGSNVEKTAMGYLEGLSKNDGSGTNWGSNNYGFWASSGDRLVIDGEVSHDAGDFIVQADASLKIFDGDSTTQELLRVGTNNGKKGMFIWDVNGNQMAEYHSAGIKIGNTSEFLEWDGTNLTVNGGGTFSGSLDAASGTFSGSLSAVSGTFSGTLDAVDGNFTGNMTAGSINIGTDFDVTSTGVMTATSGSIGGWSVNSTTISKNNISLDSSTNSGQITVGSDYWRNDGDFQFGGSDGVTYDGINVNIGSSAVINGSVTIGSTSASTVESNADDAYTAVENWKGTDYTEIDGGVITTGIINAGNGVSTINLDDGSFSFANSDLTYDSTNGLAVSGEITAGSGSIGGWSIGNSSLTGGNVAINSSGQIRHTSDKWKFNNDGSGQLAGGNIDWDSTGNVSVNGAITANSGSLANWNITSSSIQTGTFDTAGTMYFGSSGLSISDTFKVDSVGDVTATSGSIGGWQITTDSIKSGDGRLRLNNNLNSIMDVSSDGSTINWRLDGDGSGYLAQSNFEWDSSGNVAFTKLSTDLTSTSSTIDIYHDSGSGQGKIDMFDTSHNKTLELSSTGKVVGYNSTGKQLVTLYGNDPTAYGHSSRLNLGYADGSSTYGNSGLDLFGGDDQEKAGKIYVHSSTGSNYSVDIVGSEHKIGVYDDGTLGEAVKLDGANHQILMPLNDSQVGIGTDTPAVALDVVSGGANINGSLDMNNNKIYNVTTITGGNSGDNMISFDDGNSTWYGKSYGGDIIFRGDTDRNKSLLKAGGLELTRDLEVSADTYTLGKTSSSNGYETGNFEMVHNSSTDSLDFNYIG